MVQKSTIWWACISWAASTDTGYEELVMNSTFCMNTSNCYFEDWHTFRAFRKIKSSWDHMEKVVIQREPRMFVGDYIWFCLAVKVKVSQQSYRQNRWRSSPWDHKVNHLFNTTCKTPSPRSIVSGFDFMTHRPYLMMSVVDTWHGDSLRSCVISVFGVSRGCVTIMVHFRSIRQMCLTMFFPHTSRRGRKILRN